MLCETICRQYLIRMNKAGKMNPVFERIGKYYYDNPSTHTNLQICFYITVRI
ncbi:hypothetical protein DWZ79_02975 [Lachnospira eligens]|nr:hypothetical protein DWZ79_02975 [Lachnospira eligens]